MLRDHEIVQLRMHPEYRKLTTSGLDRIATDLIQSGDGEFRPELGTVVKILNKFCRARIIRQEICACTKKLLEAVLNRELKCPRMPDTIKKICQEEGNSHIWMRYDGPRVRALFGRCLSLITDASFRKLIKEFSSLEGDKNIRLQDLYREIDDLQVGTLRSIHTKGIFNDLVDFQAEEFFKKNEVEIQRKFLRSLEKGSLGSLPENKGERANGR